MIFCAQKYDAQYWKTTLNLTGHAEGGVFTEIYRSRLILDRLPARYGDNVTRSSCTTIYYMLTVRNCEILCMASECSNETNMYVASQCGPSSQKICYSSKVSCE